MITADQIVAFLLGSFVGGISVWQALFEVRNETDQKKEHIQRLSDKIDSDLKKLYPKDYNK